MVSVCSSILTQSHQKNTVDQVDCQTMTLEQNLNPNRSKHDENDQSLNQALEVGTAGSQKHFLNTNGNVSRAHQESIQHKSHENVLIHRRGRLANMDQHRIRDDQCESSPQRVDPVCQSRNRVFESGSAARAAM